MNKFPAYNQNNLVKQVLLTRKEFEIEYYNNSKPWLDKSKYIYQISQLDSIKMHLNILNWGQKEQL